MDKLTQKEIDTFDQLGLQLAIKSKKLWDGMSGNLANIGTHVPNSLSDRQHDDGRNHLDADGGEHPQGTSLELGN